MRLTIFQFTCKLNNNGIVGGDVSARVDDPILALQTSAFAQQPHLIITVGYTIHHVKPEYNPENQELVPLANDTGFLRAGFIGLKSVPDDQQQIRPHQNEYRLKLTKLIANMVRTAELGDLEYPVPTLLVTQQPPA